VNLFGSIHSGLSPGSAQERFGFRDERFGSGDSFLACFRVEFFFTLAGIGGGGLGGAQGERVLDVELGELSAELAEGVVVVDVIAQVLCLTGRHPAGAVGTITPDL
jgi:hypothetical protein